MPTIRVLLALLILSVSHSVSAALMFRVTGSFDTGDLAGELLSGRFTIDESFISGSGTEIVSPNNGLLSMTFFAASTTFEMNQDVLFPTFPIVELEDGLFDFLDYDGGVSSRLYARRGFVEYFDSSDPGTVVNSSGSFSVSAVPVPATLALMGLGLAGLGWKRRKQL